MAFDVFDSVDEAHAYRVHRAARLLSRHLSVALAALGVELSMEQWVLLWRVHERGPCAQRALTDPLFDDRANITRMVERLEAAGWLQREPDPEDARRKLVSFTDKGRARFVSLFEDVRALRETLFGGLDSGDLAAFERVLDHLDRVLG